MSVLQITVKEKNARVQYKMVTQTTNIHRHYCLTCSMYTKARTVFMNYNEKLAHPTNLTLLGHFVIAKNLQLFKINCQGNQYRIIESIT